MVRGKKMSRKANIWIGATLLIVIAFNYLAMALPLYNRMNSLDNRIKIMMIKQVKAGEVLKNTEDNYIIDILKREIIKLDRKIVIVNCAAISVAVLIISWLLFGLVVHKENRKKV